MSAVLVAVTLNDRSAPVAMLEFQCGPMRGSELPSGAAWSEREPGYWLRAPTEENIRLEVLKAFPAFDTYGNAQPQPASWRVVDREAIPKDRTFRDAWHCSDRGIEHDLEKCRDIHRDHLRQERAELLPKLDVDWMRATAVGDIVSAAEVEAERQRLRDITADPRIAGAVTVDALKAVTFDRSQ